MLVTFVVTEDDGSELSVGEGAQHAGEQPAEAGPPHPGLLTQRYERGSVLVTSNLDFASWTEVFGDPQLTAALLNRPAPLRFV